MDVPVKLYLCCCFLLVIMKEGVNLQGSVFFFFFFYSSHYDTKASFTNSHIRIVTHFFLLSHLQEGCCRPLCALLQLLHSSTNTLIWMATDTEAKDQAVDSVSLSLSAAHTNASTHTHMDCTVVNTIYFPLSLRGHRYTLNGPLWWSTLWLGST